VTVTVETVAQPEPGEIVYSAGLIAARVAELGRRISGDYHDRNLVLVTVLKGSTVFLADLSRQITIPHRLEFMAISAYRGSVTASSGRIRLLKDVDRPVRGDHVLIVEDIVDTGHTLVYLKRNLEARRPRSLRVCVLLDKIERREVDVDLDYIGFTIPNMYVVGYGFDHGGLYRNLRHVAALEMA
jgi:hypoxanthine phosphoribosyltransferase